jgi:hypothetical protein
VGDMDAPGVVTLHKPRTDARPLWDAVTSPFAAQALYVAYRLGLFPFLGDQPRTLAEICEHLEFETRPAQAMLSCCTALGVLELGGDRYKLTELAEDYLLESSPTYFGPVFELVLTNPRVTSYPDWEKAFQTNTAQIYGGDAPFESHEEQAELARSFTMGMHGVSMAPASAWPDALDLSGHSVMLDVGGGSGAHSIGAAARWPQLQAIVLDISPVCDVAEGFIGAYGLGERIRTHRADMWEDEFPDADRISTRTSTTTGFPRKAAS